MFARGFFYLRCQVLLHHALCSFFNQRLEVYAIDQIDRVKDIAFGLGHFLAVLIPNQAVYVNFTERHIIHELQAEHDHSCNPKEDDIETGDQHVSGIEIIQRVSLLRPTHGAERPQGR